MPDWTDPVLPSQGIVRRAFWKAQIIDNIKALNDIIGHPDGGHVNLTDGGILLGNGIGAIVAMAALAKGSLVVGDGTTDPIPFTVGTDDFVLKGDSSAAGGVSWHDPVSFGIAEKMLYG